MSGVMSSSPARAGLFDRLGGFDALDQAVARAFVRASADPSLAGRIPAAPGADATWQAQMFLTELTGGPMAYDGPDPRGVAARLALTGQDVGTLGAHLGAAFEAAGVPEAAVAELRGLLAREAARLGLGGAPADPVPPAVPSVSPVESLVAAAVLEAARLGLDDGNLFVLDAQLTLVHLNPGAVAGVQAADGELRRAFNLGAAELVGHPIIRIHPAPTQFSALFADPDRLPRETTWCFGRAVWKAHPFAVRQAGGVVGYGVAWRDLSEQHRNQAVFQRLRSQAEDLPVPVMLPDATLERWFGNAACEAALARLAPYLRTPVQASDGVPVGIFFPDVAARRALFADPAQLPHKTQVQFGPETVAVLVSPVLDQDQRYVGPQITWEIVHRMPVAQGPGPTPAPDAAPVAMPSPDPVASGAPGVAVLRQEARALEGVSADLLTLTRLLDAVAEEAEQAGLPVPDPGSDAATRPEALRRADQAVVEALRAVQAAAAEAAAAVAAEAQGLSGTFGSRLTEAVDRAQASADAIRRIRALAAGLAELRGGASPEPAVPAAAWVT
ncbi:MAG: hypothetical protein IPO73_15255 [Gemmatimonadetes bacterium]|nr:hypothetical protein [Gemmatimonadota bacterium]